MSSSVNPFKLETDNKKFFFDVANKSALEVIPQYSNTMNSGANRIKNISSELDELAKKREEMLFKDAQIDYIFKKEKPVIQLGDFITGIAGANSNKDKKFRVRALLKEKKQSIHQFLEKKKEIYLSKMNINIKKEQTTKLQDCIKDQEETLKARKLYFQNDVEFMHKFIDGIKKQAEDTQSAVQNQLKIQQTLVSKLNSLQAQTQKIQNLISKDTQVLNNLKTYKNFIDSFYDQERNWKPYIRKIQAQQDALFMTEGHPSNKQLSKAEQLGLMIRFQPANLLEIFNNAEQNNIREIQNLHDKEDEVETVIKLYHKEQAEYEKVSQQSLERISILEKNLEKKQLECNRFREMKKNNTNKLNILDNQSIDLEKVTNKIYEIFKQVNPKKASESSDHNGERNMKKAMTEIEAQVQKLRNSIKKQKDSYPNLIGSIEYEIKQNQKIENQKRKRDEDKQREQRKQREQQKKRNEPINQKIKGRKDMEKVIIEKKTAKKKQVDVKSVDQSQKYFIND